MNLRSLVLFIFIPLLIFSCDSGKSDNKKLKDQVIAVHDEVMPKIGVLKTNQKHLLEKANEIEKSNNAELYHFHIQELRSSAYDCEAAYDGMFVWMRQFQSDYSEMADDSTKNYLQDQLKMVEKVNRDIKSALHYADSLLSVDL